MFWEMKHYGHFDSLCPTPNKFCPTRKYSSVQHAKNSSAQHYYKVGILVFLIFISIFCVATTNGTLAQIACRAIFANSKLASTSSSTLLFEEYREW